MARYGQAFKDRAVARLLPPESAPVKAVSRELGVSVATLERWRSAALAEPERERIWTAAARLETVIAAASMDETSRSAWSREQGVFPSEVEHWRESAMAAMAGPAQTMRTPNPAPSTVRNTPSVRSKPPLATSRARSRLPSRSR